jgi:hypothetical protein
VVVVAVTEAVVVLMVVENERKRIVKLLCPVI